MVPAGVLLFGVDGVRRAGDHGPLLLHRLRQHRRLHLGDDAQVPPQHVRRVPGLSTCGTLCGDWLKSGLVEQYRDRKKGVAVC